MRVFLVGGAVRDQLLGRPVKDHDWVVVGATPEEMLGKGFAQVGADFPVFLHAETGEEYALARQERKTGPGYHGFETMFGPNVTIEEDLYRRDLTVNAMARDEDGNLIDPYGGQQDLEAGVLRHVSDAFAEDPVRVLRVARFAARYAFRIHEDTRRLMGKLVDDGELDHLTPERVWAELEKTLSEDYPNHFFWAMDACGASDVLFPELRRVILETGRFLERAVLTEAPMLHRFMVLFSNLEVSDIEAVCERYRAPTDVRVLSTKYSKFLDRVSQVEDAKGYLDMMKSLDLFRHPDHFFEMVRVWAMSGRNDQGVFEFARAFRAARRVAFASLSEEQQATLKGKAVGEAIDALRVEAITEAME